MSKIKFDHAENGEIEAHTGSTLCSNLFLIGAVTLTKKRNKKNYQIEYPTDLKGLKEIETKACESIEFISNAIEALGIMLAYTDAKQLDDSYLNSYSWLIAGLSELLGLLSNAQSDMSYTLSQTNEAKIKELTERIKKGVSNEYYQNYT